MTIPPNKALHWTGIPLRSIPASELGRYITKMNFKVPSKKELKEKYNISNEDFDILIADKLPEATDLLQNESFIEKAISYFGIPTFLRKNKFGIILAIIFLPYIAPKAFNELENCFITTYSFYNKVVENLTPIKNKKPVLVAVLPKNIELPLNEEDTKLDVAPNTTTIYPFSGDTVDLQGYKV
jgi:hypothetical protein